MILNMAGNRECNFEVTGGMGEPASRFENLLWVQTENTIPQWCFDSAAPETPEEGMVWFSLDTAGGLAFNAVQPNAVVLRVTGCSQYLSGAWAAKPLKLYQNGVWQELTE